MSACNASGKKPGKERHMTWSRTNMRQTNALWGSYTWPVWNIYQHLPHKSPSFVGKYISFICQKVNFETCRDMPWCGSARIPWHLFTSGPLMSCCAQEKDATATKSRPGRPGRPVQLVVISRHQPAGIRVEATIYTADSWAHLMVVKSPLKCWETSKKPAKSQKIRPLSCMKHKALGLSSHCHWTDQWPVRVVMQQAQLVQSWRCSADVSFWSITTVFFKSRYLHHSQPLPKCFDLDLLGVPLDWPVMVLGQDDSKIRLTAPIQTKHSADHQLTINWPWTDPWFGRWMTQWPPWTTSNHPLQWIAWPWGHGMKTFALLWCRHLCWIPSPQVGLGWFPMNLLSD